MWSYQKDQILNSRRQEIVTLGSTQYLSHSGHLLDENVGKTTCVCCSASQLLGSQSGGWSLEFVTLILYVQKRIFI